MIVKMCLEILSIAVLFSVMLFAAIEKYDEEIKKRYEEVE